MINFVVLLSLVILAVSAVPRFPRFGANLPLSFRQAISEWPHAFPGRFTTDLSPTSRNDETPSPQGYTFDPCLTDADCLNTTATNRRCFEGDLSGLCAPGNPNCICFAEYYQFCTSCEECLDYPAETCGIITPKDKDGICVSNYTVYEAILSELGCDSFPDITQAPVPSFGKPTPEPSFTFIPPTPTIEPSSPGYTFDSCFEDSDCITPRTCMASSLRQPCNTSSDCVCVGSTTTYCKSCSDCTDYPKESCVQLVASLGLGVCVSSSVLKYNVTEIACDNVMMSDEPEASESMEMEVDATPSMLPTYTEGVGPIPSFSVYYQLDRRLSNVSRFSKLHLELSLHNRPSEVDHIPDKRVHAFVDAVLQMRRDYSLSYQTRSN